ncbi:hypothetical protein EGW08_015824 [Elysia chlorotica]|uniref:Uncharacterized protein n=1 Tax=Elysia chlorotica TaxID=188477 RepID=A0A3S1BW67_ELYCH|nr:hypothetical protein EGW08_015824 [Elysia chlorotica]
MSGLTDHCVRLASVGICGDMWRDVERCGDVWRVVGRCGELWGYVEKCEEMWRHVESCGEMSRAMERSLAIRFGWYSLRLTGIAPSGTYRYSLGYMLQATGYRIPEPED